MITDLIANGAIINVTIGGKAGQLTYDRRPTTIYRDYDLRVMVRGENDRTFEGLSCNGVERLIRDLNIQLAR